MLGHTDIRISPIIIRKYDTDLSDETLQSYIAREEKNLRVTDIYGKTGYYPTIQALGASLEHTDTFCPTGYLCDAGIRTIMNRRVRQRKKMSRNRQYHVYGKHSG